MTRVTKLRRQFKASNARVENAAARYHDELMSLWVETTSGTRMHAVFCAFSYSSAHGWEFQEYITEAYDIFYKERRKKTIGVAIFEFTPYTVKRVDGAIVKKLEEKLKAAFLERERLITELESAGVDVFKDSELWA